MTRASSDDRSLIRARRPRGEPGGYRRVDDVEALAAYLDDAAHFPGGHAAAVCFPRNEADVAELLRSGTAVLPIGAQSSLTGGATPRGETLVSSAALRGVGPWGQRSVRVGAGVVLAELEPLLQERGFYYPPVPTYDGASVGGIVATNAAGAATFKYGTTRAWITALTVVLAGGDVLDIARGRTFADGAGSFRIATTSGSTIELAIPSYAMPAVPKRSAGYYTEPAMDLIDLFIGSEGTLGIITDVELALASPRPALFCGLVPVAGDAAALALATELREGSRNRGPSDATRAMSVAAIEYLDHRCLELLAEDGADRRYGFSWPASAGAALIFRAELPAGTTRAQAVAELERTDDASLDTPLLRVCRVLQAHDALADTVAVLPEEQGRRRDLFALREAVPEAVNRRVKLAQRVADGSISKAAADVVVPFERFAESLARYRAVLEGRGLDHAVWGHISDGNVHPNAMARTADEMEQARAAMLEIGRVAIELDGCPMSEHGVGRNATKKRLLEDLYGAAGVESMRRVKRALDPGGVHAPGVIFEG